MAPLIKEARTTASVEAVVCVTGQHREMLDQVLNFFEIAADFDLQLMKPSQTLQGLTSDVLLNLMPVIEKVSPDTIIVQGDTTTAFVGALAGYYSKTDVAHIEAGLRSGNMTSPFPEEGNRILAGHLSKYHFAPTERAVDNLRKEGITSNIHMVGNTVIDALRLGIQILDEQNLDYRQELGINLEKRIILVTGHRRESFGKPFEDMCTAIRDLAIKYPDAEIVYPVHLNPKVQGVVKEYLSDQSNIKLLQPLSYPKLIWLMSKSYLVITDSGGIQEEAPSLGKPVLVMRDVTERQEGVGAGTAKLVGTDRDKIYFSACELMDSKESYDAMANAVNPYGDGTTSKKVLKILLENE